MQLIRDYAYSLALIKLTLAVLLDSRIHILILVHSMYMYHKRYLTLPFGSAVVAESEAAVATMVLIGLGFKNALTCLTVLHAYRTLH